MHILLKIRFKTISPEMDLFAGQEESRRLSFDLRPWDNILLAIGNKPYPAAFSGNGKEQWDSKSNRFEQHRTITSKLLGAQVYIMCVQVEKAPLETYADVGGLDQQIQEIKEAVELPLTHPELYEDIGIKPPKVRHISCFIFISASCAANLSRLKNVADSFKRDGVTLRLHVLESQTQWVIGRLVFHEKWRVSVSMLMIPPYVWWVPSQLLFMGSNLRCSCSLENWLSSLLAGKTGLSILNSIASLLQNLWGKQDPFRFTVMPAP